MSGCCPCFSGLRRQAANKRKHLVRAKALVAELIASKSCGPILVRLAWHDSGTYDRARAHMAWPDAGGAIGSIRTDHEINAGPNAGLKKAVTTYLRPIKDQVPGISWADLIQMASVTAIELMGGPKIPIRYGRVDGEPADKAPPPFGLPDARPPFGGPSEREPAAHLRYVFHKYGMDDKDIVALSGAHTIGRAFKERSGTVEEGVFKGTAYTSKGCPVLEKSETPGGRSWTKNWLKFDNSYFTDMGNKDNDTVTFPTDSVLMSDSGFRPHFEDFKRSQDAFFAAYICSHKKLSELGSKFEPKAGITGV